MYDNNSEKSIKEVVKLKYKLLSYRIDSNKIKLRIIAYFENKKHLSIGWARLYLDDNTYETVELAEVESSISKANRFKHIHTVCFDTKKVIADNSRINGSIRVVAYIEGQETTYVIKQKKKHKINKYYFLPEKSKFIDGFAMHFRHSAGGNCTFVKRKMEPVEYSSWFRFIESKPISFIFYCIGRIEKKCSRRKVNLFYEKFASKAEEGTFELFNLVRDGSNSQNYYVIDKNSSDYERIKSEKNVLAKYSLKYYWLIYQATGFISTEAPEGHVNIFRPNNWFLKKALYEATFVFLQHGVTYMKRHGRTSSFLKGRGGEPDLMAVGSEKERNICMKMLGIDESATMLTGLPIYSLIDYKHINQQSDDYVMVMLTWKPYEEHMYDFSKTEYYENLNKITSLLKQHIDGEKIILVGHPKINDLLKESEINLELWERPISEALNKAKLLITDYSSVCYNSFYQGGGVIFYQPDLEKYEEYVGPLIPSSDEYIGHRALNIDELEALIEDTISDGVINLNKVRNEEFEKIHLTINSFTDGKNIERIYKELSKRKIV